MVKLEVGKSYKSVFGKKAVVLREDSYGFLVDYGDKLVIWHRHEDGGRSNISESNPEFSLVSEWEEPQVTHKFKVGDRVVGNSNAFRHRIGDTGIIDRLDDKPDWYWVTFDSDSTTNYISEFEIELTEEKPVVDTSNPNKTPWGKMTPEEKGALLLAHHEGKTIQYWAYSGWYKTAANVPGWFPDQEYRVKPKEPVVETVELWSEQKNDLHKITYQMVDGEPDWSTLKGETL